MTLGTSYKTLPGELDLLNPLAQPADEVIARHCRIFAGATPAERQAIWTAMTESDFYALMQFGDRCAVFAVRRNDAALIEAGLTAVAMVERDRIDYRDFRYDCLAAATLSLGLDHDAVFEKAAALAEPKVAAAFESHAVTGQRTLKYLVATKYGAGFLSLFGPALPEVLGLLPAAVECAEHLRAAGKAVVKIEGEPVVPDHWLGEPAAKPLLDKMTGAIRLDGDLYVWLARFPEADTPAALAARAARARVKGAIVASTAMGTTLGLLVNRISPSGDPSPKTVESTAALVHGIRAILEKDASL